MQKRIYYDLKKIEGTRFYLRREAIQGNIDDLNNFLKGQRRIHTKTFAKKMMFTEEIKTNNLVEGYVDDISIIERVIKKASSIKDPERRARILNLYAAYKYILKGGTIDKESIRELYTITSNGLLCPYDKTNMGTYYRQKPVYILKGGRLDDSYSTGVPEKDIEAFMEKYLEFLNTEITGNETDEYIKSQILHLYFVYIHPYFDVNGRTSRTIAMWYLLNKKAYPYIIFNRGIAFKGAQYDKTIEESIAKNDMTYFIKLMLETVMLELEKEYIIHLISENATTPLNTKDYQTLLFYISMNGQKTLLDFASFYNRFNDKKSPKEIYDEMITPLLDKGVLDETDKIGKMKSGIPNRKLILRPVEHDREKTKHLQL